MTDLLFGVIAIAAGALFCFRGYLAFRIVIPIWGAFVGFGTGAGIVAAVDSTAFLSTSLGWMVGIALAIVFAALAYLFYEVSVVLAMMSIGFSLGVSTIVAIGVSWTWVAVLVGVAFALLLAYTAIVSDLPMVLLVVLSALAGSSAITTGVLLLVGTIDARDLSDDQVTLDAGGTWVLVLYAVLAVAGIVSQLRARGQVRGSMRESWETRGSTGA
jgi:hypothetical protein